MKAHTVSMDTSQNGRFILELLSSLKVSIGDGALIDNLLNLAVDAGASLDEFEDAIINASSNGWILIIGETVHLSPAGFVFMSPANDN